MPFPYKKVLVLGATSGIGRALAEAILAHSPASVVVTGRRSELLRAFVDAHPGRAASATVDLTQLDALERFFADTFAAHPDIDLVLHNAGVQHPVNFHEPATVSVPRLTEEIALNYTSVLYTLKHALPHLLALGRPAAVALVSSGLCIAPFTPAGNYSATKAAVHHLVYTLRAQLANTNVGVVEIIPPAVQTGLGGDAMRDDAGDHPVPGMPLADFIAEAWAGLEAGDDEIAVGFARALVGPVEAARRPLFEKMDAGLRDNPKMPPHRA